MFRNFTVLFMFAMGLLLGACGKEAPVEIAAPTIVDLEPAGDETTELSIDAPQGLPQTEPVEEKRKFLSFLKKKEDETELVVAPSVQGEETLSEPITSGTPTPEQPNVFTTTEAETAVIAQVIEPEVEEKPRFLGFLRKKAPNDTRDDTVPEVILAAASSADTIVNDTLVSPESVAVNPEIEPVALPAPEAEERLGGPKWLGGGRRNSAPAAPTQPSFDRPLGVLPFGQVVPNCNIKKRDLGEQVAKAQGTAKYRLYDTNSSSIIPRTQYLSGFADGCVRQFTASLVLFGSAVVHETKRYDPSNTAPYSQVDLAYEKAKRKICGVGRGKFCPKNRIDRLGRETAFVSIYRNFGDSGGWVELLLLKGSIAAMETH